MKRAVLDTNVLLRRNQVDDPWHSAVRAHCESLIFRGYELCCAAQSLRELWQVATRPKDRNGLCMEPHEASLLIERSCESVTIPYDAPGAISKWLELVTDHQVRGALAHDAYILSVTMLHGAEVLVTFNVKDFRIYGVQKVAIETPPAVS